MANITDKITLSKETKEAVGRISDDLIKKTERILKKEEAHAKKLELEQARRLKEEKKERRRHSARMRRHYVLARKGLMTLVALGKSTMMQDLFEAMKQARNDEFFVFYKAHRPSGEAWCLDPKKAREEDSTGRIADGIRGVFIYLYSNRVAVCAFDTAGTILSVEFPYDNTSQHDELLLEMVSSGECGNQDTIKALDHNQRMYEWDPELIAGKVLIDCAYLKKLEHYLAIALKQAEKNT